MAHNRLYWLKDLGKDLGGMALFSIVVTVCLFLTSMAAGTPYKGTPFAVPGTFEAEDFDLGGEGVGYHDLVSGNAGGLYRTSESVDIVAAGSGYVVNNFQTGEWLNYTINVAQAGNYRIELRVSSVFTGSRYHVEIDGGNPTAVPVSNTRGWNSFLWIGVGGIPLTAGTHVLKVVSDQQYFNLDTLRFTLETAPPPPPPPPTGRILYVDAQSGNDSNNGLTATTPWRTIGMANAAAQPGDAVYLRGTFTSTRILPQRSGTASQPIRFTSWPGFQAIFVGGVYEVNCGLAGRSYIIVEGIAFQDAGQDGISITAGAHHITFRNNSVLHERIEIIQATDNLIQGNTIRDYGSESANAGDSLWMSDGAARNQILGNEITNGGHSCILIGGDRVGEAECGDNVVAHNRVSNRWAMPLALQWMARRTLIEYNVLSDGAANGVNYPRYGLTMEASYNTIRYNDIVGNAGGGIQVAAYTYGGAITQDSIGNQIYNNTITGNGGCGLMISVNNGRQVKDNLFANNILFRNAGHVEDGTLYSLWMDLYHNNQMWPAGSLNGNKFQNNDFLRQPGTAGERLVILVPPNATNDLFYTLSGLQTAYPTEAKNNLEVDPLFLAPGDYHLSAGSPMIDRGQILSGQAYQGAAPDIGAHEFGI